jgi:hypothetical protein
MNTLHNNPDTGNNFHPKEEGEGSLCSNNRSVTPSSLGLPPTQEERDRLLVTLADILVDSYLYECRKKQ